jgi:putative Ca2+/H+ antiporter (TMEM165/GDT1 family)
LEALLTTFLAAGLGEWGDKTQLLVIALAVRYRRPLPILAGIIVAALANSLLAAFGGVFVHGMIAPRATSLLVGLALVFAGVAGLIRPGRADSPKEGGRWPFFVAAGSFFVFEFGDKTQFLTFALAAHYDAFGLAANLPAVLLGEALSQAAPLRRIRFGLGAAFLVAGLIVGVGALGLT